MNPTNRGITWRFAGVELDERSRELRIHGIPADIEPKCFELLLAMLQRAGEVITITEFQETVWPGRIIGESAVANVVSRLRKILNDEAQEIIGTVPRVGYRLIAQVECVASRRPDQEIPAFKAGAAVPGRPQWRLTAPLQGGGYGDVWLAEHSSTGEKRVFKSCVDSGRLSALKREVTLNRLLQDALEGSDAYVRILEWNFETPPFYIESVYGGYNLREWIDHKGGLAAVPLADRIDVISTVAEALAAAHSIGVLHKDLKPENVLIEETEGRRIVRIGDFGAGKLLDADKLREFGITRLGFTQSTSISDSTTGTLIYLAPELLGGGTPSVQSDIYSLGVMLYQLVADRVGQPMASGWETDIADELLRKDIADATHGSRERRLPSAQLLAENLRRLDQRRVDLQRIRQQQQEAAVAQRALERSRVRRPWMIAAIALLLLGFVTSSFFFVRERENADRAQEQAQIAQAFKEFVTKDIMKAADPGRGGTVDETLKDAVIKSIPKVHERFQKEPLIEASIDSTLGETVTNFDEVEKGLAISLQAADLYQKALGADAEETLTAQTAVAFDLVALDRHDEGNVLLDKVLATWKTKGDPTNPEYFHARSIKLLELSSAGIVPDKSAAAYGEALLADALADGIDNDEVCGVRSYVVQNLAATNQMDKAERRAHEYLRDCRQMPGSGFDLRVALAEIEEYEGHYAQAETDMNVLLQADEKIEGPQSIAALSIDSDLRRLYEDQKQWQRALVFAKREYEGKLKALGPSDGGVVGPAGRYAWVLVHLGNTQEALSLLVNSTVLARTALTTEESGVRSLALLRLVYTLIAAQRTPDAAATLNEMTEVKQAAAADDLESPGYWWAAKSLIAGAEGRQPEAHSDAEQAVGILQEIESPERILPLKEIREMLNMPPKPVASQSQ